MLTMGHHSKHHSSCHTYGASALYAQYLTLISFNLFVPLSNVAQLGKWVNKSMEIKTTLSKVYTVKPHDPSCLGSRPERVHYINIACEAHPVPILTTKEGSWFLETHRGQPADYFELASGFSNCFKRGQIQISTT